MTSMIDGSSGTLISGLIWRWISSCPMAVILRHGAFRVKPIPAHDLIQRLLPPFVGWLWRRATAHDINDRRFFRNADKRLDLALDLLLPNGRHPPSWCFPG